MLTYREGPPAIVEGEEAAPNRRVYRPPVPEFQVEMLAGAGAATLEAHGLPALLLVLDGEAELQAPGLPAVPAARGTSWLAPAALNTATIKMRTETTRIVRALPNMP